MYKKTMKIAAFVYFTGKCVFAVPHYSSIIFLTIPGVICIAYTYCTVKTAFLFVLLYFTSRSSEVYNTQRWANTQILYSVGER